LPLDVGDRAAEVGLEPGGDALEVMGVALVHPSPSVSRSTLRTWSTLLTLVVNAVDFNTPDAGRGERADSCST
jgi:hypothetical protein